jgi:heme-degrading monooxygenase HmoA
VFAVIYRWRLKAGQEERFAAAWERVTRAIHAQCGSYGSRLHRCQDGLWVAYALWPDAVTRGACEGADDEGVREMQSAAEELVETIECEVVRDLLEPSPPG